MEGHGWIHGEKNAYPILVMYKFCNSSARYFTDSDGVAKELMIQSFDALKHIKRPIIPLRKLGQGCSRMNELAPILFKQLQENLKQISYPNIQWDYRFI